MDLGSPFFFFFHISVGGLFVPESAHFTEWGHPVPFENLQFPLQNCRCLGIEGSVCLNLVVYVFRLLHGLFFHTALNSTEKKTSAPQAWSVSLLACL